jgi:hypothetical protein
MSQHATRPRTAAGKERSTKPVTSPSQFNIPGRASVLLTAKAAVGPSGLTA